MKKRGPLADKDQDRRFELMVGVFAALKERKANNSDAMFALLASTGTLLAMKGCLNREKMLRESIEFLTQYVRLNADGFEPGADNVVGIAGMIGPKRKLN